MSPQTRLQPTRRTVLRTAAWTAPAVSIAVAAPAFAVSAVRTGTLSANTSAPVKYNNVQDASIKHVKWDLVFKNTGSVPLSNLSVVCTFVEQSPVEITAFVVSPTAQWTESRTPATFVATYSGIVAKNSTLSFTPDFQGANNSKGTLTVAISDGGTTLAVAAGEWRPANV